MSKESKPTTNTNSLEKKIEDYIHLYLGSECIMKSDSKLDGHRSKVQWSDVGYPRHVKFLLLRPLSSMTEEERLEVTKVGNQAFIGQNACAGMIMDAARTKWLLEKGFDLFQLIPAGLALDSTKQ